MEQIHGIDVSWMTHGSPKDKAGRITTTRRSTVSSEHPSRESPSHSPLSASPPPLSPTTSNGHDSPSANATSAPRPIPISRPGFHRTNSSERRTDSPQATSLGSSPARRSSWFSNISQKFSTSAPQSPPQANHTPAQQAEISVPKITPAKNAVLQHGVRHQGEGPYTPAPPKTGQAGILHVFRRLSTSSGQLTAAHKANVSNHGLVERRVLNVDRHRERCALPELDQAKLRRVSFSVDVEIAPMPKYGEDDSLAKKICAVGDRVQKRKISEKGEGEALKHPHAVEDQKEQSGVVKATGEHLPKEPEKEGTEQPKTAKEAPKTVQDAPKPTQDVPKPVQEVSKTAQEAPKTSPETKDAVDGLSEKSAAAAETRKKEKKKKSEEERKARKERKRKLAEANGQIPLELYIDSDDSDNLSPTNGSTPRTQLAPTTNPVRIYRRCCQLRETPILKKITEQLSNVANTSAEPGIVEKLDLTGYWMQLADLVTLGDYLAVVPIKEVILENCGLTDEGLRVILAGLLAAKKPEIKRKKPVPQPDGLTHQGGFVERLVLKNNKIGLEGWKHLCLFIYMSRTLKMLDLSSIPFPKPTATVANGQNGHQMNGNSTPSDICKLLSKSIGERLAGSKLELLNLGETGLSSQQLGNVIDGILRSGVRRLGLAHLDLDPHGLEHITNYLRSGKCEGLDLGGNDLRDHLELISDALDDANPLWALSLAECNLVPKSLCQLLPKLARLHNLRFIDLSHNRDLCKSEPSAIGILRRYLPKLHSLKRIHLADISMNSDQAIALAEILPEVPQLAHISLVENPELVKLADAKTEETQEEACALYASLLAATRVSTSIVCVDIDAPSESSGEIVKALAKQVVAYCLRNMERLPLGNAVAVFTETAAAANVSDPSYPVVLQHLVGKEEHEPDEVDDESDTAPDDDYVIGGTGVVKALACCLNNRGDDSRRQSGEFMREIETGTTAPHEHLPTGKARDMTKHLLNSARKIRARLEPALVRSRTLASRSTQDNHSYHRLLFLRNTLDGIISRCEDEFPDTRESIDSAISVSPPELPLEKVGTSISSGEAEADAVAVGSDIEEDADLRSISRSNSVISSTSRALVDEEARVLRAGHKFRSGWIKDEHYSMLLGVEEISANPNHARVLQEMLDELGDEELLAKCEEKGALRVYKEDKDEVLRKLREADPEHWERFIESQKMARANVTVGDLNGKPPSPKPDEIAVAD
ncbi:MAP protein 1 [Pleurostoma richardsiae]|uniref:MAP protein 1 n=1 Tax=Pleurostoma richardsiae TaxID=41990 RepID=A0AA38RM58_9PEZI|nr:MAP protein 1 [Pleurostoma richardsiae]